MRKIREAILKKMSTTTYTNFNFLAHNLGLSNIMKHFCKHKNNQKP